MTTDHISTSMSAETEDVAYELLSAAAFGSRADTRCPGCWLIVENMFAAKRAHVTACAALREVADK